MSQIPPERAQPYKTWHQAQQEAKDFAKVPRLSKGGQPIYASEINKTSRGKNFNTQVSFPQRNGDSRYVGLKNPTGVNHYVCHPDGHPHLPTDPHHNQPHFHAVNSKGEEKIITYGKQINNTTPPSQPPKPPSSGIKVPKGKIIRNVAKGATKACVVAGLAMSLCNVANAAPSDRMNVLANEVSSSAGAWAGAAAGAALGSVVPVVGTVLGSVVGGIIGSFAGDALFPAQEKDQQQKQVQNQSNERGGIMLCGDIDVCSNLKFKLDSIDKIFFDSSGNLILSSVKGKKASIPNCEIKEEDFLLALLIAYRNLEISFSLDPWNPLKPDGPSYQKVFYPDILANTSIGQTLFECDYIMKKLSFGLLPLPPNVKSTLDHSMSSQMKATSESSRHRLWIISENIPLDVKMIENDGSVLQYLEFGDVKMKCCCRKLNVDPTSPSGLRDSNEPENTKSPTHLFAQQFSANYGKIAEKYPQFERLRNLSKLVALAKYLRDRGVKINEGTIMSSLAKKGIKVNKLFNSGPLKENQHEAGKEKVPRLTASKEKVEGNMRSQVTLFGGVDLGTNANWNVIDTYELPKGITKSFLASISANSTKNSNKSREIKTPDGGKALVIPLSVLSPELPMNNILDQGELMVDNDPPIALEIATSAIRLNDGNRREFMLLANSLAKLSLHRDAVAAYTISAMLSDTTDEYESAISLADLETAMVLSETLHLNVVCSWNNLFHIHCPKDWIEIQIDGVDDSLSQIYASKPSPYIPNDSSEMLMVTEISDVPDFSEFLQAMQNNKIDGEVKSFLYLSSVSKFLPSDSNTVVRRIMTQRDAYKTVVIAYTIEKVNGENFANYNCWIIPNPDLGIKNALFLLITCSDMHIFWMDQWAKQIFEKSTEYKYVNPPKQKLSLHLRNPPHHVDHDQDDDEDEELKRVLEMSKYDF